MGLAHGDRLHVRSYGRRPLRTQAQSPQEKTAPMRVRLQQRQGYDTHLISIDNHALRLPAGRNRVGFGDADTTLLRDRCDIDIRTPPHRQTSLATGEWSRVCPAPRGQNGPRQRQIDSAPAYAISGAYREMWIALGVRPTRQRSKRGSLCIGSARRCTRCGGRRPQK